ncbi:MAG: DUF29 domain-containing protein [Desulfobacterales bacterium]|nr:DUF29 domain-containing protein [Desulfobacterales bacterium]MBF0396134.1 DUF29 domain-containing protein [Desulfobacterales bacterium]
MNNLAVEYKEDFYSWLCHNVKLLRDGKLFEIDIENIAEELEGMSKSQQRELISRLRILLAHLLKWQFQSDRRSNSWKGTIIEQRNQIKELLKISPSLKSQIEEKKREAYIDAIEFASLETGIPESDFPQTCPYILEEILDKNFYPMS